MNRRAKTIKTVKTKAGNFGIDVVVSASENAQAFSSICLSPFGFISKAISGIFGVMDRVGENGDNCLFGYEQKDDGDISDGEIQIYSMGVEDGENEPIKKFEKKATITLRANSNIELKNEKAQIEVSADGKIEISQTKGATITILKDGEISINTPEKIKIASDAEIELSGKSVKVSGDDTLTI